jgi:hypothetical protein
MYKLEQNSMPLCGSETEGMSYQTYNIHNQTIMQEHKK